MITAIEVVCILYAFKLYSMSPPILQMQVHLEGMLMVAYKSTDNLNNVVKSEKSQRSMLTEYFNVNRSNPATRQYPRKVKRIQIGRLVYANPAEGERYYLRIMLNHVRGATSYEKPRTWRGSMYATFRQACECWRSLSIHFIPCLTLIMA